MVDKRIGKWEKLFRCVIVVQGLLCLSFCQNFDLYLVRTAYSLDVFFNSKIVEDKVFQRVIGGNWQSNSITKNKCGVTIKIIVKRQNQSSGEKRNLQGYSCLFFAERKSFLFTNWWRFVTLYIVILFFLRG